MKNLYLAKYTDMEDYNIVYLILAKKRKKALKIALDLHLDSLSDEWELTKLEPSNNSICLHESKYGYRVF